MADADEVVGSGRVIALSGDDHDVLPLEVVAQHYGLSTRTIKDARWRRRAGLKVTRLGGAIIGVQVGDLRRALASGF